jgi:hypothetical protein
MENKILELEKKDSEEKKTKLKSKRDREQDQYRVVINRDAQIGLEGAVRRVGENYEGGIIDRSGVANYVFMNLARLISETDIKAMRHLYFNETMVLNTLTRKALKDGNLPEDLKRALREHYGIIDRERKGSSSRNAKD